MAFARYVTGRAFQSLIVLLMSSVIVFALVRMTPGNPAQLLLGPMATPEQLLATTKALGLDQPIVIQYFDWILRLVRGDMGMSLTTKQPVAVLIGEAFKPTLWLLAGAMIVAIVVGIGLGTWAAATRSRWLETTLGALMSILYGAPAVWVGLVAILVFAVRLH